MPPASPPRARDANAAWSASPRPNRRRQGSFRFHPALNDFYKHDRRRARSRERDLGLRWRARDHSTYRAAWIEETGELYSVRHGNPAGDVRVTVLARLDGRTLDRALDCWREVCDSDRAGSYEWLLERAGAVDTTQRDVAEPTSAVA